MAYVYRHIRLDKNEPFYIGLGTDDKGDYKRAFDKEQRNCIWGRIVAKTDYEVQIVLDNISLDNARQKEIEFIALYRRKCDGGILSNITKGGQGVLGLVVTKKVRDAISERHKGNSYRRGIPHTEATKLKISVARKGKPLILSDEARLRMKIARLGEKNAFYGRKHSPEAKAKIGAANSGERNFHYGRILPDWHKKIFTRKGIPITEEQRKRNSEIKSIPCYQFSREGILIKKHKSASEAARYLNNSMSEMGESNIIQCCKGRRLTHKGFKWSRNNEL